MEQLIGNAGKQRIFAFIIDNLSAIILSLVVVSIIRVELRVVGGAIFCAVYLLYFLAFEAIWSRTPGKLLQGLEVKRLSGERCDLKGAVIRTLLRVIEVNPLLFGAIPAGITVMSTKRKQRIGDILAKTVVVSSKAARPAKHRATAA